MGKFPLSNCNEYHLVFFSIELDAFNGGSEGPGLEVDMKEIQLALRAQKTRSRKSN